MRLWFAFVCAGALRPAPRGVASPSRRAAEAAAATALGLSILTINAAPAAAAQREDVIELTNAAYPIIKQLKPAAFQPFVDRVVDLLLQAKDLDRTVDAGLTWFNSVPDAKVAAAADAVKAAFDGLDPAACDVVPLPTRATFAKVSRAAAGADAAKLKAFADRAAPFVAALGEADVVCLPPAAKLEAAALAQADAANAADAAAGVRFNLQASKSAATAPKGPLLQLFTSYDGAKQTLGASREERARFAAAGKRVETAATVFSRQAAASSPGFK